MTTIGYIIIILGAASVSINLMHFIDRLDKPQSRRRRRYA